MDTERRVHGFTDLRPDFLSLVCAFRSCWLLMTGNVPSRRVSKGTSLLLRLGSCKTSRSRRIWSMVQRGIRQCCLARGPPS
eukprot:s5314_g5.t4